MPKSITKIGIAAFANSGITSIDLTHVNYIWLSAFEKSQLKEITNTENITNVSGRYAFLGSQLDSDLVFPNLLDIGPRVFQNTKIRRVLNLGSISELTEFDWTGGIFNDCIYLYIAILPPTLEVIKTLSFSNCTSLSSLILKSVTPPTLSHNNAFVNTPIQSGSGTIYVPDDSVTNYQEATNWNTYSTQIKGISNLQTDNPDLYEEVKDYI